MSAESQLARQVGRQARELAAFAERRGMEDELEAVREALVALERRRRELEPEEAAA